MKVLDRKKLLDFMKLRKDSLYNRVTMDFGGGIEGALQAEREVKYWKEAVERGEFDTEIREVYVILSATRPEIVDFTFYTELKEVLARVDELNKLAKSREYWYITIYSNLRNSGNLGKPCAYCGENTKSEWAKYCCYQCEVNGERDGENGEENG